MPPPQNVDALHEGDEEVVAGHALEEVDELRDAQLADELPVAVVLHGQVAHGEHDALEEEVARGLGAERGFLWGE